MMPTLVKVTCLCGQYNEHVELFPKLPVDSITCSCEYCRYSTGVLFVTTIPLARRPNLVSLTKSYQSSPSLSRYFCGRCGTHICVEDKDNGWSLCAGVVDGLMDPNASPTRLQAFTQHEFVGSTVDGGLVVCLAESRGQTTPMYLKGPTADPMTTGSASDLLSPRAMIAHQQPASSGELLFASCQCGGVQYNITRPTSMSRQCSSPWPDLLVPHSAHSANPQDIKWWLCDDDTKYLAGTCACRSCRLASGCPIQTWAFVPKTNVQKINGLSMNYDFGSLKRYNSSPGTYREFCSVCGASVFWHCDERPDLVDVSVGLLRAPEGSRAEGWLKWHTKRLSFKEDAFDRESAEDFEKGLQKLTSN